MSSFEDQLKTAIHRVSQMKPAALDEFMRTVSERAKTDGKVAQAVSLAKQLKEQAGSLGLKLPDARPSAEEGTAKLTATDIIVIALLILFFP